MSRFNITSKRISYWASLITMALMLLPFASYGQTIRFSMDVQPELGVEVLQDLNFGTAISNSGRRQILPGDPKMGIFKIRSMAAQSAVLTLIKPDSLVSPTPGNNHRIPVHLQAAYSDHPDDYSGMNLFRKNSLKILLGPDLTSLQDPKWANGYVYIYGSVKVGDVPAGDYAGTLILNVAYQ